MTSPNVMKLADVFSTHLPVLRRLVRQYLRQEPEDTEDVLQTVWIKAQTWVEKSGRPDRWKPWLSRIAANTALSHLRRQRRRLQTNRSQEDDRYLSTPDPSPGPDEMAERSTLCTILRRLDVQSPQQARAVRLVRLEGMTCKEAAGCLGVAEGTVQSNVFFGLRNLSLLLNAKAA